MLNTCRFCVFASLSSLKIFNIDSFNPKTYNKTVLAYKKHNDPFSLFYMKPHRQFYACREQLGGLISFQDQSEVSGWLGLH